jgi:hypothetical protein
MEYGFNQVAATKYEDKNKNQLQVEIYEMKDSSSAYGAYTFYLNGEGKPIQTGTEGMFIDYYAAFWKGNFLTVISVPDYKEELKTVLEEIAVKVNSKIHQVSQPPAIISIIRKSGISTGFIKYLKGNITLSNVYRFIPGNAFAFKEGVSFTLPEAQVILMKFESEPKAATQLSEALTKMKEANKETIFTSIENGCSYVDYKSNLVFCVNYKNYLIILIGKTQENFKLGIEKMKRILE